MLFLTSWLRSLVKLDTRIDQLARLLTMAGLEVEEIKTVKLVDSNIVVGNIVKITNHPNVCKQKICDVDDGNGELLQIVCGASNLVEGINVPLARVGAILPNGKKIMKRNISGFSSHGMLCSAAELNLSNSSYELFRLSENEKLGEPIYKVLGLVDQVISINITPNRGDCLSVIGLAREIQALTNSRVIDSPKNPNKVSIEDSLKVKIQDQNLCGRFSGRIIRNIHTNLETPVWIKNRLKHSGYQSVSILTDISNYIMLERGLPCMIFDLDKIHGDFVIRFSKKNEIFRFPNGFEAVLDTKVGVISIHEQIVALAGISENLSSSVAVGIGTKNIYIGLAFWFPTAISGCTRHYKIYSESHFRSERGIDYEKIPECLELITQLIIKICGGQVGPINDQCLNIPIRDPIRMRLARFHQVVGIPITLSKVKEIFDFLNFKFEITNDGIFLVKPPSYRFDLELEEDLIEEVVRIYGFESIPAKLNPEMIGVQCIKNKKEEQLNVHDLRSLMAIRDYHEMINFSFVRKDWEIDYAKNSDPIELLNPISKQNAVMRSTLIPGLIANIAFNVNRKQTRVRVFELGRVFMRNPIIQDSPNEVIGISQVMYLSGAAWGTAFEEQWGLNKRLVDYYDVKGDVEILFGKKITKVRFFPIQHHSLHPGKSAAISLNGKPVGWIGQLHPTLTHKAGLKESPIVFELNLCSILEKEFPQVSEFSNQPLVIRDLSLQVDVSIKSQSMIDTIYSFLKEEPALSIIQHVYVLNVWNLNINDDSLSQKNKKSITFRFYLQDPFISLQEQQITACINQVGNKLMSIFKADQRI